MAEVVNLRQARKAKSRSEQDIQAAKNRAKFGRPKAERTLAEAKERLNRRRLEEHRLPGDADE